MINQKHLFDKKIKAEQKLTNDERQWLLKERERAILEEMKRKHLAEKKPWKFKQ